MSTVLQILAVVVVALAFLWFRPRPDPSFILEIRDGRLEVSRGKVARRFLQECRRLVDAHGIADGTIRGFGDAEHVSLEFSREIPEAHHQRFRNVFHLTN
ncbi:MAG: DUF3634 family protein [Planctomycetota bacterium]|nr:DUF3634 family protein [Planctomycetota bacterium]